MKCVNCPHQQWAAVTGEVVERHLSGRDCSGRDFVLGLYPMLLDETCWFLAVDFDGAGWMLEAGAYRDVCEEAGVPCALERSRSGNGGHVWLFFDEVIPAVLARSLGAWLLTRATAKVPQTKLRSYDRFFPNQDTLPRGGFGNLIALPLQKEPRGAGNSVFVDDGFEPYEDQWAYLSSVGRVTIKQIEILVESAHGQEGLLGVRMAPREEDGEPWKLRPSRRESSNVVFQENEKPGLLKVVLSDQLYFEKSVLPASLQNALVRIAAFQNPEFYKAQAMRLPVYDKPRIIACAEDYSGHLALPRGCLDDVRVLMKQHGIRVKLDDKRNAGEIVDFEFKGELQANQKLAARDLEGHDTGILAATTAFGKTVLAAWMIAKRGVNTLVLVHRKQLMDQWVDRLEQFLGLDEKEIGRLGGGRKKLTGKVDVALIQSLVRKGEVKDLVADYGHLVVDECHHLSAHSFELVARRAKAKYVLGLSATVTRKDGHHPILFMQCGQVRHRVDAKSQAAERPFRHEVIVRPTGFRMPLETGEDLRLAFQQICDAVYQDEERNKMIAGDVVDAIRGGRTPLVLTERTEHLEMLQELLEGDVSRVIVLKGGMGVKKLKAAMAALRGEPDDAPRVILATGRFIGEGFDDSRLDTLFLTMPVSWKGTIAQYAGRLHRLHKGKKVVQVFDYADLEVPMLSRMFDRRCEGYEEVGYSILLPASAMPGWPIEVPLPVDPQWKNDYAASVRRLIVDGVDVPLARLFVHATRPPERGASGEGRARSASEKFLFRRLETLPDMKGKFQLNASLPIPFNEYSEMEVDYLCAEKNLVIELDGDQHLADKAAYRRDRKKDMLLQENGYLVLRFLASDLSMKLPHVLDSIQRVMNGRDGRIFAFDR